MISKTWTNIKEANGQSTASNTTGTIIRKARNSPIENYNCDYKFDTKESYGNMSNPIF